MSWREIDTEFPYAKSLQQTQGTRTVLATPLLREGIPIGTILMRRTEVRPFTDKQIALLKTFADQAVIAIENVRLFKELDERTNELTRSVGELQALGEVGQAVSSTLDLETVLTRIVSHAVQLTGTDGGAIYEYDEQSEEFHLRGSRPDGGGIYRCAAGESASAWGWRARASGSQPGTGASPEYPR